jgi:hypothetical protein
VIAGINTKKGHAITAWPFLRLGIPEAVFIETKEEATPCGVASSPIHHM